MQGAPLQLEEAYTTTQVQHEKRVYGAGPRLYVPRNQKLETGG
jgi:hypothetical protein